MENLGEETDLGRRHGVVVGEEELELEDAAWGRMISVMKAVHGVECWVSVRTFVRRLSRAVDLDVEIAQVVLVRDGTDSRDAAGGGSVSGGEAGQRKTKTRRGTYGSAMSRSVSFTMRLGRAMVGSVEGGRRWRRWRKGRG